MIQLFTMRETLLHGESPTVDGMLNPTGPFARALGRGAFELATLAVGKHDITPVELMPREHHGVAVYGNGTGFYNFEPRVEAHERRPMSAALPHERRWVAISGFVQSQDTLFGLLVYQNEPDEGSQPPTLTAGRTVPLPELVRS
jgi:hypothetical protein